MYPHIKTAYDIKEQAFVTKSKRILTGYTENQIKQLEGINIKCGKCHFSSEFYIVDTVGPNILGLKTSTKLNLIK